MSLSWVERAAVIVLIGFAVSGLVLLPRAAQPYPRLRAWEGDVQFSMDRAWADVTALATWFPRRWSGGPDRPAAADWLAARLEAMGLPVRRESFTAVLGARDPVALENVWAVSRGAERPGEIVVVVGNYDMAPTSFQAASDTAGHVGTILELARVFASTPHQRTFLFLFPDGEEWGMLGARHFVRTFPDRRRIVAALSIEDLDVGALSALGIDGTGQFRGFTPMWMRELAASAAAHEGYRVDEAAPFFEWLLRALLIARTDQGPFLEAGIPAVDLAGRSADQALKNEVYHLPGDTIEKMRPASLRAYGRIQERILRGVDELPGLPRESEYYLRLGPQRFMPGFRLVRRQVLVFLPLLAAVLLRLRRGGLGRALGLETIRFGVVLAGLLTWVGSLKLLPVLGVMPRFALYPPPPRHPLLTTVQWVPVAVSAVVLLILAFGARRLIRSVRPGDEGTAGGAAVTAALTWLLVISLAALLHNPFAAVTFLILPACCWIWVDPGRPAARRAVNGVLVLIGFAVVVMLFAQYGADLRIGWHILWYVFLALAYAQFTWTQIILSFATVALGLRLLALGMLARPG